MCADALQAAVAKEMAAAQWRCWLLLMPTRVGPILASTLFGAGPRTWGKHGHYLMASLAAAAREPHADVLQLVQQAARAGCDTPPGSRRFYSHNGPVISALGALCPITMPVICSVELIEAMLRLSMAAVRRVPRHEAGMLLTAAPYVGVLESCHIEAGQPEWKEFLAWVDQQIS